VTLTPPTPAKVTVELLPPEELELELEPELALELAGGKYK